MKKHTFVTATLCTMLVLCITAVLMTTSITYAAPNVSICKRFLDTSDPPPYELRTIYHWDMEMRVSTDVRLTRANVYDRFGGELKIDHITIDGTTYDFTYPDYPEKYTTKEATVTIDGMSYELDSDVAMFGTRPYHFIIYWSGKTHKVHFQWVIGNLDHGHISVVVGVSTDYNPGGQPQFTSPCEHVLNSGATVHARCGRRQISAHSESLWVKVACERPGRLLIDKFNDVNGNSQFDFGETKIPGWRVDVTDPLGVASTYCTPVDMEITEYGAYIITEEVRADWTQTAVFVDGVLQDVDPTVTVTINLGETHEVLYGNTYCPPQGRLIIKKFHDKNGNGIFDGTDEWITSWDIDVTNPSGDMATYPTPVNLEINEFGLYTITENLRADWAQTVVFVDGIRQTLDPTTTVTVNPGESHEVIYGNRLPSRVVIRKFNDENNNGVFDGLDVWLSSWNIDVTDPSGDLTSYSAVPVDLVITEFGTYIITETIPLGWVQTALIINGAPHTVNPTTTVTINPGDIYEVHYGNYKPPTPISITMTIDPIGMHPVGSTVTFSWSVLTILPEIEPQQIELVLVRPDTTSFTLLTRTDFPAAYSGSEPWTAELPTGMWTLSVYYTYEYLGVTYPIGTFGSFIVTPP